MARAGDPTSWNEATLPGADDVVHLVVALVEDAGGVEPPHDVHAPIDTREADVTTDRQRDGPSGAVDLVGQLDPGRRRTHHEHAAVLELRRRCGTRPARCR